MYRNSNPWVQPLQSLAWALGMGAIFLAMFGVGSLRWWLAIPGASLLVAPAALLLAAGLLQRRPGWVRGTAVVVSAPEPPANKIVAACEFRAVIEAPGKPAMTVTVRERSVPIVRWPHTGDHLLVQVGPGKSRRVRVDWSKARRRAPQAGALDPFADTFM